MSMLPSDSAKVAHRSTRHSIRNHCLAIGASAAVLVFGLDIPPYDGSPNYGATWFLILIVFHVCLL